MAIKTYRIIAEMIASKWLFGGTLLLFAAESGWLALTSRFPMAFDEAYHYNLIVFFSHRLSPLVTSQTSATYKFGALIQNPSLFYHYLLSFPYRLVTLFTSNVVAQVIALRLLNVGLALGSLYMLRKLLLRVRVPRGLANLVIFAFAFTPMVTVLSAQINYDNLFILAITFCLYEMIVFVQKLERKVFDTQTLLILVCLCLFSGLIKYAFLPFLLAIILITAWKLAVYRHRSGRRLLAEAVKGFKDIRRGIRLALVAAAVIGSFLFLRIYAANSIEYHNPVPPCNSVLSVSACQHYYAWRDVYNVQQYDRAHPASAWQIGGIPSYTAYWLLLATFFIFGVTMPLRGPYYLSPPYYMIIALLTGLAIICIIANFKKLRRRVPDLLVLCLGSCVYLFCLWVKNYQDYSHLGQPVAVNGRYWVPVLSYSYALGGMGVYYAFKNGRGPVTAALKSALSVAVIVSFLFYGGFRQYLSQIDPVYGRLGPTNDFTLSYGLPRK